MKGFFAKGPRKVDVVLQVTEPGKDSETVIISTDTYSRRNGHAQNRAVARERLRRPEGTRVARVASGEAGEFDDLLNNDRGTRTTKERMD